MSCGITVALKVFLVCIVRLDSGRDVSDKIQKYGTDTLLWIMCLHAEDCGLIQKISPKVERQVKTLP